jgi:hypothetical protein
LLSVELNNGILSHPTLRCAACGTHLADPEAVISNEFQGTLGPAYLIQNVCNVFAGPEEVL